MSTVSCKCGKVKLGFVETKPRFRYECCCEDCRQKAIWAWSQGGPEVDAELMDYKRGFDTIYFGNCITSVTGQEHLTCMYLREPEEGKNQAKNYLASCCSTILAVDLAIYAGNSVLVPNYGAKVETDLMDVRPAFHGWTKDFPTDKLAALQEFSEKDLDPVTGDIPFAQPPQLGAWFEAICGTPAPEKVEGSTTIQELQRDAFTKVLGLEKGAVIEVK